MLDSHLIYCADNPDNQRINQGALLPTILSFSEYYRVFIGFLDKHGISRIGFIDLEKEQPKNIIRISQKPTLDIGEAGCFDDNGVVPISVLTHDSKTYLYYVGFQLGVKVPYYMFLGLAISMDNGENFYRFSKTPILDRNDNELFARCGAHIQIFDDKWHMWYIGSVKEGWIKSEHDKKLPLYSMRHATSENGVDWEADPENCLSYIGDEHGFGRAHVIKDQGLYKMFFSSRKLSSGYSLAYAESLDLVKWTRKENPALNINSKATWDNLHKSYPFLVENKDSYLMFYNGNNCGKEGFGYAEISKKFI